MDGTVYSTAVTETASGLYATLIEKAPRVSPPVCILI